MKFFNYIKQLFKCSKHAEVKDTLNNMTEDALHTYAQAIDVVVDSSMTKDAIVSRILKKLKRY